MLLGISKATFLSQRVVPANPNDLYYNNKCSYCWEICHALHPGVRILPCNHIFGQACLLEIVNNANGDVCPICRAQLFQPPWRKQFSAYTTLLFQVFLQYLKVLVIHAYLLYARTPQWLKETCWALFQPIRYRMYSAYDWADCLLNCFTSIRTRSEIDFSNARSRQNVATYGTYARLWLYQMRLYGPSNNESIANSCSKTGVTLLTICACHVYGIHGEVRTSRDKTILVGVLLMGTALAHLPNLWVLYCFVHGWNPMVPVVAVYKVNRYLGYAVSGFFGMWYV